MLRRLVSIAFFISGLGLLGAAASSYLGSSAAPAITAVASNLDLGDCLPGQQTRVIFHLANHSRQPIRVLGLAEC
jgi:hypothetical protein